MFHWGLAAEIPILESYPGFSEGISDRSLIDRILGLGAGTGRNACLMMNYLSKQGQLIGADISEEMISRFERKCADFPKIIEKRL